MQEAAKTDFLPWSDLRDLAAGANQRMPYLRTGPGALRFCVSAREAFAAISVVEDRVRRMSARIAVGLPSGAMEPANEVLVGRVGGPLRRKPFQSWHKEVFVPSIQRSGLLFVTSQSEVADAIDDAFELLAGVQTSTSWASVASAWAVVEGLLSSPDESGASAADKMAAVVACSFPRAEMTQLAEVVSQDDGPAGESLRSRPTVTDRLDVLMALMSDGATLPVAGPADLAAVGRLKAIVADKSGVLERVRGYCSDAFRRMYQQRNLVMHKGRSDSVALPATLRTVPALVAAGVDRLVHAGFQAAASTPQEVAARASNELALVGQPGGRKLYRLLD
ncbi:hypothetical protein [Dactylosporangium sp. CA-233914]|uniref:hypothetical protein n=1 Tax=Dactylosporangium sp. CA-233914 TaxID=3239934 RepID=UPI003D8BCE0D